MLIPCARAEAVDWEQFRRVITNMTDVVEGPIVFKSMVFGFYLEQARNVLPRTCVVHIRRDPVENAMSILRMRRRYSGSIEHWTSLKPREYCWLEHEAPVVQAAGQALYCNRAYRRALRAAGDRNVLTISLADLSGKPATVLEQIRELLNENGAEIPVHDLEIEPFETRSVPEYEPGEREAVERAVADLERKIASGDDA